MKKISAEEFIKKHNIKTHIKKESTEVFKEIKKESSKFEELTKVLYKSHDVEKRCEAIKKLVISEDPRGKDVLIEIMGPRHYDSNFYSDHHLAITSSIHEVSSKKRYADVLIEYGESENEIPDYRVIELFYDHLETFKWIHKEDIAQMLKELMSIEKVYPFQK